jgi:threonine dehydrogenase-like Zn-dependent dehydrogenase
MHASSRVPVPAGVDPVSAALSINQREILSVTRRISFEAGSRVAVLGSGYNGLLFSLFCNYYGAGQVAVLGNPAFRERGLGRFQAGSFIDYKTPRAAGLVCRALGGSPTHVIDAVGSLASLDLAGELLAPETAFGCYGVRDSWQKLTPPSIWAPTKPAAWTSGTPCGWRAFSPSPAWWTL